MAARAAVEQGQAGWREVRSGGRAAGCGLAQAVEIRTRCSDRRLDARSTPMRSRGEEIGTVVRAGTATHS